MRTLLSILILSCISLLSQAQKKSFSGTGYDIQWGDVSKENRMTSIIGADSTGIYLSRITENKDGKFREYPKGTELYVVWKVQSLNQEHDYTVAFPRPKFEDVSMNRFQSVIRNGELTIFFGSYGKGSDYGHIAKVVINKFGSAQELEKITSVNVDPSTKYHFYTGKSENNRYAAFLSLLSVSQNQNIKYGLTLYDAAKDHSISKELEIPFRKNAFNLYKFQVSNKGELFVLGAGPKKSEDGIVDFHLLKFSSQLDDYQSLKLSNISDKIIHSNHLQTDFYDNQLILTGFYISDSEQGISGCYFQRIHQDSLTIHTQSFKSLLDIEINRPKPSTFNFKYDKEKPFEWFVSSSVSKLGDGCLLALEKDFYINTHRTSDVTGITSDVSIAYNEEILLFYLNNKGQLSWTNNIPKLQKSTSSLTFMNSYYVIKEGEEVKLIYNDLPRNMGKRPGKIWIANTRKAVKKLGAIMVTISQDGMVDYELLFRNKDIKGQFAPGLCTTTNFGAVFFAFKKPGFGFEYIDYGKIGEMWLR